MVSSVSFCFRDANMQGSLTKIRACEHLQKFCEREQANTHRIFASNSSKGQISRALSNGMNKKQITDLVIRRVINRFSAWETTRLCHGGIIVSSVELFFLALTD